MNKIKCKCGHILDRDEIEKIPSKIDYCPKCRREINLNKLPKEESMKVDKKKIERTIECIKLVKETGCEDCKLCDTNIVDCIDSQKHTLDILEIVKNKKEI